MTLEQQHLAGLPELLIPNGQSLQIVANCYWLCQDAENFEGLADSYVTNRDMAKLYDDLCAGFRASLDQNRDPYDTYSQRDIGSLRDELRTSSVEEALIRSAALLTALSRHLLAFDQRDKVPTFDQIYVRPTLGEDCAELCIAPRPRDPVNARQAPGLDTEQDVFLSEFHPGLHVHFRRIGAIELTSAKLPRQTEEWIEQRVRQGKLRIAIAPLFPEVELDARPDPRFPATQPTRFRVHGVKDEDRQVERLNQVLDECKHRKVSILILPEIRITEKLLSVAREFLRKQVFDELEAGRGLLLLVAGSRHLEKDGNWVNRCTVLDSEGEIVWEHDKLRRYRIRPESVTPELKAQLSLNEHGGIEAIHPGRRLIYCDGPFGRFTVAICAGFFHSTLVPLLEASGANWFFVPAMSPGIRPLEDRAGTLVNSHRAITFVANCACIGGTKALSFYRLPIRKRSPVRINKWAAKKGVFVVTFNTKLTSELDFTMELSVG